MGGVKRQYVEMGEGKPEFVCVCPCMQECVRDVGSGTGPGTVGMFNCFTKKIPARM